MRETASTGVILTFDNLGEASELQRRPRSRAYPTGRHPSVTQALPRLLGELDRLQLRATFFVEAINCRLNPAAVSSIADGGHELGVHGWCHEQWAELEPQRERELLELAADAFASLRLDAAAFRPPGGELTSATPALLRELGYRWCSPAIDAVPDDDHGLRWIPFDWELVDAYHLMERFAPLRLLRGDRPEPLEPVAVADRLTATLRDGHGVRTVIMHPFLMLDDAWWDGARRTLAVVAELSR